MSRAARDAFLRARNELQQTISTERGYAQGLCALGVVDAALGNKEDAIREGELAVKLMPASQERHRGFGVNPIPGDHLCVDGRQGPRN